MVFPRLDSQPRKYLEFPKQTSEFYLLDVQATLMTSYLIAIVIKSLPNQVFYL